MSKLEVITQALFSNPLLGAMHQYEQKFCPDDNVEGPHNRVHEVHFLGVPSARLHTAEKFNDLMDNLIPLRSEYVAELRMREYAQPFQEGYGLLNLGHFYFTEVVGEEKTTIVGGKVPQITREIRLNPEEVPHLGSVVLGACSDRIINPCVLTGPCTTATFPEGTYIFSNPLRRDIYMWLYPGEAFITERILDHHKDPVSVTVLREKTVPLTELLRYEQPVLAY
jgi:hypothetical protein